MHLVIPMSGQGARFRAAGYTTIKPLIEVAHRPLIAYVLAAFPGVRHVTFICNEEHLESTPLASVLHALCPSAEIRAIAAHKLGPVHAVMQAYDAIDDGEPVIVNYCDFGFDWDFSHFLARVIGEGADGAVPGYIGFHPHNLGPSLYAFMRTAGERVLEIREKHHFTPNKLDEYASSGTYYFRSGALLKHYFSETVRRGIAVNGEYYVSSVYQVMIEDGLRVLTYPLRRFLQFGTPEDLEAVVRWSRYFESKLTPSAPVAAGRPLCGVVLMAGEGARYAENGYPRPKPLIEISGRPMSEHVINALPPLSELILVLRRTLLERYPQEIERLRNLRPNTRLCLLDGPTEGQAQSAEKAIRTLDSEASVLIASCDTGLAYDPAALARAVDDPVVEALAFAFCQHQPAAWHPEAYGWLVLDETGRVRRVSTKQAISADPLNDHGVVGTFYFRQARDYLAGVAELQRAGRRVKGEYYIDELLNVLIERGLGVYALKTDFYPVWGTPEELKTYEYWQEHFHLDPQHPYRMQKDPDFPTGWVKV